MRSKVKFINYSGYRSYRMDTTTIQLSKEMKEKLASFGMKGESYDEILRRVYDMAVKEHIREFLMSEEDTISIDEAIKEAKKKWPESG